MRLHQLTKLDADALATEKSELVATIAKLTKLIADETVRTKYMVTEIKAIATRHGEVRRSAIIDPPETLRVEKGTTRTVTPSKPKFLKIDMKRGIIESAKGPRGALILEKTDKLITITSDGTLKKLPANFKGTLGESYSEVKLAKKETEVATRKYLLVFSLDGALKAMVIDGETLCKSTSKGKSILPEGATMVHFGEGTYSVRWVSTRKKPLVLDLATKPGKPGTKGTKVANLTDITLA